MKYSRECAVTRSSSYKR